MDGFKDSTKMKYMMGGDVSAYKSGGTVKKAMGGAMKSVDKDKNPGLSKLPTDVRNKMGYMKKGGVAEKAMGGACAPVKKMRGGMMDENVSSRPTTASGRRMTNEELGMGAMSDREMQMLKDTAKKKKMMPKGMGAMSDREMQMLKDAATKKMPKAMSDLERARMMVTRPLPRKEGGGVPSYSDKPMIRRKTGGLSVMPKGKC
jgi:hypothetical protein